MTAAPRLRSLARIRVPHALASDDGSTSLEFAVSCTVQMLLLLGVFTLGQALYAFTTVCSLAREGSRWASVRGSGCTVGANSCAASSDDIQTYVRGLVPLGITASSVQVTTTWINFPANTTCSGSGCNKAGNLASVTVAYPFLFSAPLFSSHTWNFTSTSAALISQ